MKKFLYICFLFWVAKPFTPVQEGTKDFEEWNDWFSDDAELGEIIQHLSLIHI